MSRPKTKGHVNVGKDRLLEYAHVQLAYWNALRRMGFDADDIYAAFYNGGELFTTLKVGGKEWSASISEGIKISAEPNVSIYTFECQMYNAAPNDKRDEIFRKYMPVEKMIQMAISLRAKGIVIPALPDAPPAEDMAVLQAYMEGRLVIVDEVDGVEAPSQASQEMPN